MSSVPKFLCEELSKSNDIIHGFFSRSGGNSKSIYESLNCGLGSGDDLSIVKSNRKKALESLVKPSKEEFKLVTLYQIHSNKVSVIDDSSLEESKIEADAMVSKNPRIALGILTADCTPVLFADMKNKIIGAAHAGWKGAFGGVLENTILKMIEIGAQKENIIASIGPTISQKSYEVGEEFYERLISDNEANEVFFILSKRDGHYMFDLPAYVANMLKKAGISFVFDVKKDTCPEENNFFSYRRSCLKGEKDYGRNLSIIAIKE